MSEKGPEIESQELEPKPRHEKLREISNKLGFIATEELQNVEKLAVSPDIYGDPEEFTKLMTKFQELGETITQQVEHNEGDQKFALARIGLMIRRAAVLSESYLPINLEAEIYNALTELDNLQLEDQSIINEIEDLYKGIKASAAEESEAEIKEEPTVNELAQFCQGKFHFNDDEVSSLIDSGDFASAIATATIILADRDPNFDEEEFFQSLIEAGLIEST